MESCLNEKEIIEKIHNDIQEAVMEDNQELLIETMESIPASIWEKRECIIDILDTFIGRVGSDFFVYPIDFIPKSFWDDSSNAWSYIVTLCDYYENEQIDYNMYELFPRKLLENKDILMLLLRYNYDETIYDVTEAQKEDMDIILAALEGVQNKIEFRKNNYNSMLIPLDEGECFEEYLNNIPKSFSTNKDFILRVMMGYMNFLYETDAFYEWIDEGLWADKDFVMEAIDVNADLPIRKISKEIIADKEFLSILEREYDMHGLGCELLESGNVDIALICIEYDAEKGNKKAQIHLSELYSDGKYIEKSLEKAEKWRKIADQN